MKSLHAVIHVLNPGQAIEQVTIARENGADGVWLIDHEGTAEDLTETFRRVRQAHPNAWIGLNYLTLNAMDAMRTIAPMHSSVDGLWTDDAEISEGLESQLLAERVWAIKQLITWTGLYFGGVAFKGQRPVQDVLTVVRKAAPWMDVVTTSGAATGMAAPLTKVRLARAGAGDKNLAIASGITPENVGEYLPYVDYFLVSTGISEDFHHLDAARVRELADKIHGWSMWEGSSYPSRERKGAP